MRALLRSDRGATAVEYGLLAGLVALGILGSLVTTKTSLSSVFNKAASGVGSAGTQGSSQSALASYWDSKTLSSVSKDSASTTFYYTDGSYAAYTPATAKAGSALRTYDTATRQVVFNSNDLSGNRKNFEVDTYYPNSSVYQTSYYSDVGFNTIQNGQITGMTVYNNNPDGSRKTTQVAITPTADYLQQASDNQGLYPYFAALAASH